MSCLRLICYSFAVVVLTVWRTAGGRPKKPSSSLTPTRSRVRSRPAGDEFLKNFQFIIARKNAAGGALGRKFELVPFDDKLQPAEALIALKSMTDQNIPFVMHCTGSNVGSALIDAVSKHNARNPDNRILYLNCGALATELTNEQCDFWHFRFAGSVDMRAAARIKSLPPDLKKVYLLNQDYLFGQSIQRDTQEMAGQTPTRYRNRRRRIDAVRQGAGLRALCRRRSRRRARRASSPATIIAISTC